MSRIQDALKRAQQTATRPAPAPRVTIPLHGTKAPRPRSVLTGIGLAVGLVAVLGLGLLYHQTRYASAPAAAGQPPLVAEKPVPRQSIAPEPASVSVAQPAAGEENTASPTHKPTAENLVLPASISVADPKSAMRNATDSAPATAPVPSALRLDGILYQRLRPAAIINGQTVFVGDEVAGARVVAIEPGRVRLLRHGKISILNWKSSPPDQLR